VRVSDGQLYDPIGSKDTALARRGPTAVRREEQTLELDLSVAEALSRFRAEVGVPILSREKAARPPPGVAFAEIEGDGFVLRHLGITGEIGPQAEGTLVPIASGGSRLTIRTNTFGPTRSQRVGLGVMAASILLGLGATTWISSTSPILLALFVVMGVLLIGGHRKRQQRQLDLLARVQRVFGPVTRAELGAEAYRALGPTESASKP